MKYKAVIFDLDGTLLDSLEDLADSANSVLAGLGYPIHPVDDYKYFVGDGMKSLMTRILPAERRRESLIDQCVEQMRNEYRRRWDKKSRPYEGIPELLDKLGALRIKRAVLSNKPQDFTRLIVEEMFSHWNFDMVLGMRRGVPAKPDPTGALEIVDALGIPAAEFLYLGDTNTDMITANAAGIYSVGALWGFRESQELLESGAKSLINHPLELLLLL